MIIYAVIWIFVVAAYLLSKNSSYHAKYFVYFSFFLMTIVLGLRGVKVGEDTSMYIDIAERTVSLSWREIFSSFPKSQWRFILYGGLSGYSDQIETFYLAYSKVLMSIFHNAQAVLMITAVITNVLFAKFILDNVKNKSSILFAMYVYMCDAFFMNSFNIMRQVFAISIAVQSIQLLKDKKYVKAILCVLIAACFHQSALIFLVADVFFLLNNKKEKYKYLVAFVLVSPLLLPTAIRIVSRFSMKYAGYLTVSFWGAQLRGTVILWGIIAIVLFFMIRSKKTDEYEWWLIYMATIYIGIELIGVQLTVISRVALYYRIGLVLLFPAAEKYFERNTARIYRICFLLLMTISYFSYANSPARVYSFCF